MQIEAFFSPLADWYNIHELFVRIALALSPTGRKKETFGGECFFKVHAVNRETAVWKLSKKRKKKKKQKKRSALGS